MHVSGGWRIPREFWPAIPAGALAGLVGALSFATAHAVIIAPIWGLMWGGLMMGAFAGAVAGWALAETMPAVLTATVGRAATLGAGYGAVLWLLVTPVTIVDMLLRRFGVPESTEAAEVAVAVTIAILSGGLFAWLRTRRWRATIAGACATLQLTIAMAGPVPIGRSQRALLILLAVLPAAMLAGAVVAALVRWLSSFVILSEAKDLSRVGHRKRDPSLRSG